MASQNVDLNEVTIEPFGAGKKNEEISRLLSVPASTTFTQLHIGLQIAFQWNEYHASEFKVRPCTHWDKKTRTWDYLLAILEQTYDMRPGSPERSADEVTLADVFEGPRYKGKIEYIWDLDEMCSHIIKKRKKRKAATDRIVCITGEGKPPPRNPPFVIELFEKEDKESVNQELQDFVLEDDTEPEDSSNDGYRADDEDDFDEDTDDDTILNRLGKARIVQDDTSASEYSENPPCEVQWSTSDLMPEQQVQDFTVQPPRSLQKRAREIHSEASMSDEEPPARRIRTS